RVVQVPGLRPVDGLRGLRAVSGVGEAHDVRTAVRAGEPPEAVGHTCLPAVAGAPARADAYVGGAVGLRAHGRAVRGPRGAAPGPDRVGALVLMVVALH